MSALRALDRALLRLLLESQHAARRAAHRALDASLSNRHAAALAAVISRFVHLREGARGLDGYAKAAALSRLAAEEASELANLALIHAAEKRALRSRLSRSILAAQKHERRHRRRALRRQRAVFAVALRNGWCSRSIGKTSRARVPARLITTTQR